MSKVTREFTLEEIAFLHGVGWEHFVYVDNAETSHALVQGLLTKLQPAEQKEVV